jgi:succinyl-diaminopimelate desuccinylase
MPGLGARGERVNLVCDRDTGKPKLSIYAHTDVVPAANGWTRPPFRATREGDRFYGRGVSDMKGTIASLLAALEAAAECGIPLRYDPRLLFCTDEEGGAYPGVRWLAEQGEIAGHLLCLDGSAAPRLWAGSFGSIDIMVTVHGIAAHAGKRGAGENALEKSIPILAALMQLKARIEARESALPTPPTESRPYSPLLSVTVMRAGVKAYVVPDRAEIVMNRRYMPEEDGDAAIAELRASVEDAAREAGARIDVVVQGHLAATLDPHPGPHWPRWQAALAAAHGWRREDFTRYGSTGSSDMGWVQRAGIKEILLAGLSRSENNVHGADENVRIEDLLALARAILFYLSEQFEPA